MVKWFHESQESIEGLAVTVTLHERWSLNQLGGLSHGDKEGKDTCLRLGADLWTGDIN